jgi:hypothetical protein
VRAAVTASLAREIDERNGEAGSDAMHALFWFGVPDWWPGKQDEDQELAVSVAGMNPFRDVGGMFELAGFLSQTSPAIQAAFEAAGVNTRTGSTSLFPELTYDPETGRMVPITTPVWMSMLTSYMPQVEGAATLAGISREGRLLRTYNPDAWAHLVSNSVGVPAFMFPTTKSKTEEVVRAEMARGGAAESALRVAMRTGHWGDALRYENVMYEGQLRRMVDVKAAIDSVQEAG